MAAVSLVAYVTTLVIVLAVLLHIYRQVEELKLNNSQQEEQLKQLKRHITNKTSSRVEKAAKPRQFAAFTAYPSESKVYKDGDIVQFDAIVLNHGTHYDPKSSVFTCPVEGYYMFSLTVRQSSTPHMHAQIVLDGTLLVYTFANNPWSGASALASTLCTAGQKVWVTSNYGEENGLVEDKGSVFTGTLLYEL